MLFQYVSRDFCNQLILFVSLPPHHQFLPHQHGLTAETTAYLRFPVVVEAQGDPAQPLQSLPVGSAGTGREHGRHYIHRQHGCIFTEGHEMKTQKIVGSSSLLSLKQPQNTMRKKRRMTARNILCLKYVIHLCI